MFVEGDAFANVVLVVTGKVGDDFGPILVVSKHCVIELAIVQCIFE